MNKLHTLYTVFFCIATLGTVYSQERKLARANEEFNKYSYIDAREIYLKVAEDGYREESMLKKLGDSYYFTSDYINAAKWYKVLYDFSNELEAEYLYRYALSLKSTEQYDASDLIMEEFLGAKSEDYRANLYKNERNYLEEIEANSGRFTYDIVDFNSELSDFAPAFYPQGLVIATNRSKPGVTKLIHGWNDQPFLNLLHISMENDGSSFKGNFEDAVNTKYHESSAVFTKDGNTMYFTRNNFTNDKYDTDSENISRLKLYRAKKVNDAWEVQELPFNSNEFSTAHPALSIDEQTLYFSSDRPGGMGMSDLYKVSVEEDGFGVPENLGAPINTEGRDTFPFLSSGNKLYFASDGHVGLGGLDVFVTSVEAEGTQFGKVYNVGSPINSTMDDFTFIVDDKTGKGYFASNREGGAGKDDIYSFTRTREIEICNQEVTGEVLDKSSNLPIAKAVVHLVNNSGNIIESAVSDRQGKFNFNVGCSGTFALRVSKDSYETEETVFATTNKNKQVVRETLYLTPGKGLGPVSGGLGSDLAITLGLNPISFDLDKSNITPDAAIELQKVIEAMKTYPSMKISIRSHTDSRGSDSYNLALSQERAQATLDYIVEQGGIDRGRMTAKGFGESQLVNECSNGVKCSAEEHQLNRRSEFIIEE